MLNPFTCTEQELVDYVIAKLIEQGEFSVDGDDCRYRSSAGAKCAAGMLIADEFYDPKLEGSSVSHQDVMDAIRRSAGHTMETIVSIDGINTRIAFLRQLQAVHDEAAQIEKTGGTMQVAISNAVAGRFSNSRKLVTMIKSAIKKATTNVTS